MLKKLLAVCVIVSSVLTCTVALAAPQIQYEEGTHYVVRGKTLSPNKEIREFFSFWCGHCYLMQKTFKQIKEQIPEAKFVPNPVMMLGGPMGPESQKALVVASNFGLTDEFTQTLFYNMHERNKIPMTRGEMAEFMTTIGIPQNKFLSEVNSFPVLGQVSKFDKAAEDADIDAVPELLVNGKYLVIMESVENDAQLIDLVRFLVHLDDPVAVADPNVKSAK